MTVPKVFVASSSEALDVVDAVQELLEQALGGTAEVWSWPGRFQLTQTYIESLENLLNTSDFAVLVLRPDDRTTSREARAILATRQCGVRARALSRTTIPHSWSRSKWQRMRPSNFRNTPV